MAAEEQERLELAASAERWELALEHRETAAEEVQPARRWPLRRQAQQPARTAPPRGWYGPMASCERSSRSQIGPTAS